MLESKLREGDLDFKLELFGGGSDQERQRVMAHITSCLPSSIAGEINSWISRFGDSGDTKPLYASDITWFRCGGHQYQLRLEIQGDSESGLGCSLGDIINYQFEELFGDDQELVMEPAA